MLSLRKKGGTRERFGRRTLGAGESVGDGDERWYTVLLIEEKVDRIVCDSWCCFSHYVDSSDGDFC
jgi:hypothetical protein